MTSQTNNHPASRDHFSATCTQIHALVASRVQTTENKHKVAMLTIFANSSIRRMTAYHNSNPSSTVAPAIMARIEQMQAELDAALNPAPKPAATATATESGQAALLFIIALLVVIVCLYVATSSAAVAAGYENIIDMMTALTHIFPTLP